MKRSVSLIMAMVLTVAFSVPVSAASPSTKTVMETPVTVSAQIAAAKGYILTPEELALIATTPEEAVALALAALIEGAGANALLATATSPELIAMAKMDILKNAYIRSLLAKRKISGKILSSATIARADGKAAKTSVTLTAAGLTPGQKVAIMFYNPGDLTPRMTYPVWSKGKLKATLPSPCTYNLVY